MNVCVCVYIYIYNTKCIWGDNTATFISHHNTILYSVTVVKMRSTTNPVQMYLFTEIYPKSLFILRLVPCWCHKPVLSSNSNGKLLLQVQKLTARVHVLAPPASQSCDLGQVSLCTDTFAVCYKAHRNCHLAKSVWINVISHYSSDYSKFSH